MKKGTWQKTAPLGKYGGYVWAALPLCNPKPVKTPVKKLPGGVRVGGTMPAGGIYLPIIVEVGTSGPIGGEREYAIISAGHMKEPPKWEATKDWWWWSVPIPMPPNPSPEWQPCVGKTLGPPQVLTHAALKRFRASWGKRK